MIATILVCALAVIAFVASLKLARYASSPLLFLILLACTVYLASGALRAFILQDRVVAHAIPAIIGLGALGTMLYRRVKGGRKEEL
jgi:hypothetical protein